MAITCEISTKDRWLSTLPLTLQAILNQTLPPDELLLFNDGDVNLDEMVVYQQLFKLMEMKGIKVRGYNGEGEGQVMNHQKALYLSSNDLVWRLDDDELPEANVLERLFNHITSNLNYGAVAGLVLKADSNMEPRPFSTRIEDVIWSPSPQWMGHFSNEPFEVDHLYSSFLYRKECASDYNLDLSPIGHREETLFTWDIKRKGYKLWVLPNVITWHLHYPLGGIRSNGTSQMIVHDEKVFRKVLAAQGVMLARPKVIYLRNGIGDHLNFKFNVLPKIVEKYAPPTYKVIVAAAHHEAFEDVPYVETWPLEYVSHLVTHPEAFDIYAWMRERNWRGSLEEAYEGMYIK